jgi:PAS domain S-box-containing protein
MNDKVWLGRMPRKIVLYYLILSGLWIYFSNTILKYFINNVELFSRIATYEGWAFVAVTAVFLYLLLKRYVSMIRDREQNYQTLADSGQVLVWLSGTDKLCNYFNKTWLEFTGRILEQEMGNGWAEGVHPDDLQRCLDIYIDSFDRREKFSMEYRLKRHDGEYRWLQDDGVPRYDNAGEFIGYIGFCLDITESKKDSTLLKSLEEHIRQSQKLESIGTLAGGVAHDFNNILTVIIGACALLDSNDVNKAEQLKLITQINDSAERASKLTQSLLAFSRKQFINKQSEDLCYIVKIMQDFLGRIIGEDILLTTYLPDQPLMVMIDRGQIEQVLMNLAANARDAMPRGGVLNISVSQVECDENRLELEGCIPGDYAMITFSDSGEGMDKGTLQRIFEPFFTTKVTGKGTGLGLSMVYGIVRRHDGAIHVYSEPGDGATFKIYLPLRDQIERTTSSSLFTQMPGGNEIVLLVEDDPEVLEINKGLLERAGYMVLSALDGTEALEIFKQGADKIALVILDVIMPGLNGKEVYEKLKAYKQNVKVLFASGYTADILNSKGIVQESNNFISKPLNPPVFLGRVRMLIDG